MSVPQHSRQPFPRVPARRPPRHAGLVLGGLLAAGFGAAAIAGGSGDELIVAAMIMFWVPSLVAWRRHVTNTGSVVAVNVLLGWTVLGWVVALAMALRTSTRPRAR